MLVTYNEGGTWYKVSLYKCLAPIKVFQPFNAPVTIVRPVAFSLFGYVFDTILLRMGYWPFRIKLP